MAGAFAKTTDVGDAKAVLAVEADASRLPDLFVLRAPRTVARLEAAVLCKELQHPLTLELKLS